MKLLFSLAILMNLVACQSQPKKTKQAQATDSLINGAGQFADSAYREGAGLIAANDCLTCHTVNQKNTGPSFKQIANRYPFDEGVVENLAHAVIHGSKGLWGEKEMPQHPNISFIDAKKMTSYILSLNDSISSLTP